MKKYMFFLLLPVLINALSVNKEKEVKNVFIDIAKETNNSELLKEANNLKFPLIKNYKEKAKKEIKGNNYSYMKKICKDYNIDDKTCLNKFIEEIENNNLYYDFRVHLLSIDKKTTNRKYIEKLYKTYPEYKEILRVNFDTNQENIIPLKKDDLKIIDIYKARGEKKEKIKEFLNYYYLFGIFIFLLLIARDFKSKKTKKKELVYISILTIIYLYLHSL